MSKMIFALCLILMKISPWCCAPLAQDKLPPKEMEDFMKRFGYIDSGPNTADALYTEDGFKKAVQEMQRFGGLPETGELDEATLSLTKAPRCGVPDVIKTQKQRQKRYIIGSNAWRKRGLTYFLANWPGEMYPEVTRRKLEKAFQLWAEITPLKFTPRDAMDADLIIAFGTSEHGDGYPFDGRGGILAHAFFPYEHGPYGGDIHFDDDEYWIDEAAAGRGADGVDLYTVAAHEIGHSLGLAHSTVPGSIMFPYYKGYDPNMRLDYDDMLGMYSLYVLDGKFEDEITQPPVVPSEEPRSDGDRHYPKEDDDDDAGSRKEDEDYIYPTSEETPRDEDVPASDDENKSDEKGGGGGGDDNYVYDYQYYGITDNFFTDMDIETEGTTVGGHIPDDYPKSTESSPVATPAPTEGTRKIPELCDGSVDAASLLGNEFFVFKGYYMWRLPEPNKILPGYPVYFHYMGFPWSVRSIDAVYQRSTDYSIIFFTGRFYWTFDGSRMTSDSPRPLTDFGLPDDLDKLDAALVWAKNKRTYLFSGDLYWSYDETTKTMVKGYPQRMLRWRGVPSHLDAAFTWTDGKTYFFRGKQFWRFNNQNISVDAGFPLPTGPYWFGCTS